MNEDTGLPETLHEAVKYFAEGDNAFEFMRSLRWADGVVKCPHCESEDVRFLATRKVWECKQKHAKRQFSVKVGTIFEDSPVALEKWFCAIWMVTNCKNGVSSYEIHRELGVTQKTGWFMLHRIRLAMQSGSIVRSKLTGTVEVDESFIGGKARNMHADKRAERITGRGAVYKTPVMGLLEKHTDKRKASKVIAKVVPNVRRYSLVGNIREHVEKGTEIHSDALKSYEKIGDDYTHKVVDHAECYVKDGVSTNGLENFWSLLKRTLKGTYVSVEPFHLFRYLSEQVFRFNERKEDNHGRFLNVMSHIFGRRITYKELTGGVDDYLPCQA